MFKCSMIHKILCKFLVFFLSAIVSTLKQVPPKIWEAVTQESSPVRNVAFSVCIIQAMLAARQLFGAQGLNEFYPFLPVQTSQAIMLVLSRFLRPADEDSGEPDKEKLTQIISQVW